MLKRLGIFGLFALCAGALYAEWVKEEPIRTIGAQFTVSVSTSALTKINPTSPLAQRTGVIVNAPATNTGTMYGILGNCTSTSVSTTTAKLIEIGPSDRERLIPIDNSVCLWLYTSHTAAENIVGQEVNQGN